MAENSTRNRGAKVLKAACWQYGVAMLVGGMMLIAASHARAHDRDNNPPGPLGGPGTNWENPPGPKGGPGTSPDRRRWWRIDRDDNPPGPIGGPGTNWENPPGPRGGPGASPDRRRWTPRTARIKVHRHVWRRLH